MRFISKKTKTLAAALIIGLVAATAILFQNCAKSIDLNQYQTSSTSPNAPCPVPANITWAQGASSCFANNAASTIQNNQQVSFSSVLPSLGSATFVCQNGLLTTAGTPACDLGCKIPASYTWSVGGVSCTGPTAGQTIEDNTSVVLNSTSTNTGSVNLTCSNDVLSGPLSPTCVAPTIPGCTAPATLTWTVSGVTCTATGGQSIANNQSVQVTSTTNSGTATYTCANQVAALAPGATCYTPPTITGVSLTPSIGCPGDPPYTYAVTATGAGTLTYQWYSETLPATTFTTDCKTATCTGNFADTTTVNYYAVVTSSLGGSATSGQVTATGRPSSGRLCSGGGGCFVKGTPVTMANGQRKAIDQIQAGDQVLAFNELTNENYIATVEQPIEHVAALQTLHHFALADGRKFTSNAIHPIYVVETKTFMKASEIYDRLNSGHPVTLRIETGELVGIDAITLEQQTVPVYNLEVDGLAGFGHSYYVNGVLVHNKL